MKAVATKLFSKRMLAMACVMMVCLSFMTTMAFASTGDVAITSEMLEPVVDSVTSNIAVILPVGLALFAVFLGISLIPRLFKKFTNA